MSDHEQQSTHKTGRLTRGKSQNKVDPHAPEIKPQRDSDEVLGAIEGVEKQLDALRGAHEEHRKINAELSARRAQIDELADQVESRESELSDREVELAEMRQELEDRESEIVQRSSGLEQRESQLAQHAETIEELEAVVETKSQQIDQRVEELDKQLEGISVRKDELAKLEELAKERLEQDNKLQQQIDQLSEELENTKATLGGREIELKERAKAVEELAIQAGRLEKQLAVMSEKSRVDEDESLKLVDELQNQLDEAQSQINAHDDSMTRALVRIDELEAIATTRAQDLQSASEKIRTLESIEKEHAESKQQLESLEALASSREQELKVVADKLSSFESIEQEHEQSLQKIESLEAQLAQAQQQFDSARESLESAPSGEQIAEFQSKLDATTTELESTRSRAQELEAQLLSVSEDASKELEASQAQITQLTEKLQQASKGLQDASDNKDQLTADLQSKLDAALARCEAMSETASEITAEQAAEHESQAQAHQAEVQELKNKIAQSEEQISIIRTKYDELSDQLIAEQKSSEESAEQLTRVGDLLDASSVREGELIASIEELNEQLELQRSEGAVQSDEWTVSRRQRLDRVKSILRQQSDKVRRATEALRDRYDQCEKVLLKRAELVEAYQAVSDAQAKLAKREARSGTLLGLSGLGILLLMIAGVSWFIAGQVAPGAYASRVTLVAQAGERTLTTADIESWQGYIEQSVTDPQFVEKAAQGMKRRGIKEFAVAGTLGSEMKSSLDVISAEPGKIELEYRGQGASRTQRVLDTYALSLTSQANAARARRIDGAMTTMQQSATAGEAPLDTARVEMAGMIFGGSSFATFVFGGIFWRRMAKLKANFERDSRVEPLFDEDSWAVEGKND